MLRTMNKLFKFCAALDRLNVLYGLKIVRDDAVMVTVMIPGEYLEIEFLANESIEIERFVSQGVEAASDGHLDRVLATLSS
jgi:hypothetical protein